MRKLFLVIIVCLFAFNLSGCVVNIQKKPEPTVFEETKEALEDIPSFSGKAYVVINDNEPYFTKEEITTKAYEFYSELDSLGRCGVTMACIGQELMPEEERGSIGQVKPSGWQTVKYDFVDGKYLYNRCHLIGFQLTGENANVQNLITGTRYMNVEGMLPFENMVADYVKETGNHCMYRATPIFQGNNLVASGVLLEAYSVEDQGEGVLFNVYCYNNQPGIEINYTNGESRSVEKAESTAEPGKIENFVLNVSSKKFHRPDCSSVKDIKEENKQFYQGIRETLTQQGYKSCGSCKP
ncbi:MAG: hypothetical protein E7388_01785 [Ruminococcaceae bacterium]|nr:hypothetical protein [Oscillospiraceae bacterium]